MEWSNPTFMASRTQENMYDESVWAASRPPTLLTNYCCLQLEHKQSYSKSLASIWICQHSHYRCQVKSGPPLKKEIAHRIGIAGIAYFHRFFGQLKSSPRSAQPRWQCCKASATSVARWEKEIHHWDSRWSQFSKVKFRVKYLSSCSLPISWSWFQASELWSQSMWEALKKNTPKLQRHKGLPQKIIGPKEPLWVQTLPLKSLAHGGAALAPAWRWKTPMLHDERLYLPVAESLFASLCDQTPLIDFKCGGVQVVGT